MASGPSVADGETGSRCSARADRQPLGGFRTWPRHAIEQPERDAGGVRRKAGFEDVRIHDLRHSYASRILFLVEIQPMIGKSPVIARCRRPPATPTLRETRLRPQPSGYRIASPLIWTVSRTVQPSCTPNWKPNAKADRARREVRLRHRRLEPQGGQRRHRRSDDGIEP